MNEFVANEIEKAGVHIDCLLLEQSVSLSRMIAKARFVFLNNSKPSNIKKIKQVIETYTEFPHLKKLYYFFCH